MRGKRLSRDAVLRVGAIALAVLAAVLFLPGLLSPPEPPPLPADVGLGATGVTGPVGVVEEKERPARPAKVKEKPEPVRETNNRASRGGGSKPPLETREKDREPEVVAQPPPTAPPPAPEPAPAPAYVAPTPAPLPPAEPPPGEFGP
jgi:hypothetical protein